MPARSVLVAALAAVVLALAAAPQALAADAVAGFDDLAAGTTVSTQYKNTGGTGRGVEFGVFPSNAPATKTSTSKRPVVTTATGAQSGTRVGELARTMPCGFECTRPPAIVWGRFGIAKQRLKVFVGDTTGTASDTITLTIYNSLGNQLGSPVSASVTGGTGFHTPLQVNRSKGEIAYFSIQNSNAFLSFGIDDVTWDIPDSPTEPPPPPDFDLALKDPGPALLGQGGSVSVPFLVGRSNNSTGVIGLSVDAASLPPGVHGSILPAIATDPNGEQAVLTLTADANAPPIDGASMTVVGSPSQFAGSQAHTLAVPLNVVRFDLRAEGIEVTQGVQPLGDLFPSGNAPGTTNNYAGVSLVARGITVVRFWADAPMGPTAGIPGAGARLRGFRSDGTELPGGPLFPLGGTHTLKAGGSATVTMAERADPTSSFYFVLPSSWTHDTIKLQGDVLIPDPGLAAGECDSAACRDNNRYALSAIRFRTTRPFTATSVRVIKSGQSESDIPDVYPAFDGLRTVTPLGDGQLTIKPYVDTVDVTAAREFGHDAACETRSGGTITYDRNCAIFDEVWQWAVDNNRPDDGVVGVSVNQVNGAEADRVASVDGTPLSGGGFSRPYTSLAHEMFHMFGRPHASPACGGNGEDWPADEFGFLQGVGLDRRLGSGGSRDTPFAILADSAFDPIADVLGSDGRPATGNRHVYDLMSYCAFAGNGDPLTWVSPHNWISVFERFKTDSAVQRTLADPVRPAALTPGSLRVTAVQFGDHFQITHVAPAIGLKGTPGDPSPYTAVVLSKSGAVLAQVPMTMASGHADGVETLSYVSAIVPGRGAAKIEVRSSGAVVADRARSAHTPRVKLLAPRRGRIGSGRSVAVRWRSSDADGPGLLAAVDYSVDGGGHYRTVFQGPDHGAKRLPSAYFAGSRNARIRVRVSDGFNQAVAVSGRLQAAGARPTVRITSPMSGMRVSADATLYLAGQALDDALRPIASSRMQWFAGTRRLGHGRAISVRGLAPGKNRIRLVARDRRGRRGSAAVAVTADPAQPVFLALSAPAHVGRRARRVSLTVAASFPTRLTVTGAGIRRQQFAVDSRSRKLKVKVLRGTTPLRLTLTLGDAPPTFTRTVTVARG